MRGKSHEDEDDEGLQDTYHLHPLWRNLRSSISGTEEPPWALRQIVKSRTREQTDRLRHPQEVREKDQQPRTKTKLGSRVFPPAYC